MWEYIDVEIDLDSKTELKDQLNEYGKEGWQLVKFWSRTNFWGTKHWAMCIFMRKCADTKDLIKII